MTEYRIIYQDVDGGVSVLIPYIGCGLAIEEIAAKDVPEGMPWRIVSADDLPPRNERQRWFWTDSGPITVGD